MIIAFETYKYPNFVYIVGGVFESWSSPRVKYYVTSKRQIKQGETYIDYIVDCLKMLNENNITHILINGYSWSVKDGVLTKGFGRVLQEAIEKLWIMNPTIIGISAIKPFNNIPYSVEIKRGSKNESLWITSTEYFLTGTDAKLIARMHGNETIPKVIQDVKEKVKEYLDEAVVVGKEKTSDISAL